MSAVKRYDIYMHSDEIEFLRECDDGDYVKFADFEKLVAALEFLVDQTDCECSLTTRPPCAHCAGKSALALSRGGGT